MIGDICRLYLPYYDIQAKKQRIKARPALIIGEPDQDDLTVLPVSRVTDRRRIDPKYDLKIDPAQYPNTGLSSISYIRTNKVFTSNTSNIHSIYCNLRTEYPDVYISAIVLFEEYTRQIIDKM